MVTLAQKSNLRLRCFKFLDEFGDDIRTKFDNVCGKTGQYSVPTELFQKRTSRKNRSLISRKTVKDNNLTIDQLNSFEGGVAVEFINFDFFSTEDEDNETYIELKDRLGSDGNVSSIITFRSEGGSSSSSIPREALNKFLSGTNVKYQGQDIRINRTNYEEYFLEQNESGGIGNEKRSGFLFISIRGGQQDTIESHKNNILTLFNPACEYANSNTCEDINLVLSYFALHSIDRGSLSTTQSGNYNTLINDLKNLLRTVKYQINGHEICLLDYCNNHPSMAIREGELIDPIQIEKINIENFSIKDKVPESIDLTHNEAVNKERFYWDDLNECLLSPARPTNVFRSFHLSNMMQQDFDLKGYLEHEDQVYEIRRTHSDLYEGLRGI